jgi:hypothetical protein
VTIPRRRLTKAIAFVFVCASVSARAPRRLSMEAPPVEDSQLLLVLDRNRMHVGDTTVLRVFAPVGFLVGDPEAYYSSSLQWKPRPHTDPSHLRQYEVTPRQPGDYSILVRAKVSATTNAVAGQTVTRNVLLTVAGKEPGVLTGNIGLILGALLGLIGSFAGIYFKDFMDRWSARRNRFQWLTNELVGRLEAARLDVRNGRSVNYQAWMEELYSKHYSALRQILATPDDGESLGRQIIEIEGLLREYNQSLSRVSADENLMQDIDRRIDQVQRALGGPQG